MVRAVQSLGVSDLTQLCLFRWSYVQKHNVLLPDEYDQIHNDLQPFWGLDPTYIQKQQKRRQKELETYTIKVRAGEVTVEFDDNLLPEDAVQRRAAIARGKAQVELLQEVEKYLPDLWATFSAGELPSQFIEANLKKATVAAAASGKPREPVCLD